jgi:hypothetical protein
MIPTTRLATLLIALAPTVRAGGESETEPYSTLGAELAALGAAPAAPSLAQRPRTVSHGEVWSVTYDNDSLGFLSRNVTNGWTVSWLSDDVDTYGDDALSKRFRNLGSNLGWVGDRNVVDRVSFHVGQEYFTPADITVADPPTNVPPYAGVLFVDAMIHTRDEREQHNWAFRLGFVGGPSFGEEGQELFQDVLGGDEPMGWDHQLHTELIFNVDYEYRYRGLEGDWGSLDFDLDPIFGWSAGTYSVLVHTGAEARLGKRLPEGYGITSYRSGARTHGIDAPSGGRGLSAYAFISPQVWGVAKYLPYDGNTWKSSRDVDSEHFVGSVAGGLAVATGGLVFRYSLGWFTDKHSEDSSDESRYGTLSLSWSR